MRLHRCRRSDDLTRNLYEGSGPDAGTDAGVGNRADVYVNFTAGENNHNDKLTFRLRRNAAAVAGTECRPAMTSTSCTVTGLNAACTAGELLDVLVKASSGSPPTPLSVTWGVRYQ